MGHQEPDREQRALPLPFRQAADRRVEQRRNVQLLDDAAAQLGAAVEEADREIDRPAHRLRGPGRDLIGQIEEHRRAVGRRHRPAAAHERAAVERQHSAHALEQRRLAGSVRADEAEHLALAHGARDVGKRGDAAVSLREVLNLQQ